MKDHIKTLIWIAGVLLFIVIMSWGGWHVQRWFNYNFQYEGEVKKTIHEMVKPECLK